MKRFLTTLLFVLTLGICAVCVEQWRREANLRHALAKVTEQLVQEHEVRIDAEERAERFEQEISRLTTLRAETEAALLVATEEVQQRTLDQTARGYSIGVLMNHIITHQSEAAAYKQLASQGSEAITDRNEVVTAQNAAIEKQNAQLKQLTTERDEAITQLNARTREFNELVEKYNKLAKDR